MGGARRRDRLDNRRGDSGMAGGTAHHARWPAILFGPGDHHGANNARGLPFGLTANKGAHWFSHRAAGARTNRAGSFDDVPPEQNAGTTATPPVQNWSAYLLVDSTGLKLGGA